MNLEKLFLTFLSQPTYEQARIAGLKELLRQTESHHLEARLNDIEVAPELEELIKEAQAALKEANKQQLGET